jgi:hypothetical protein
MDTYASSYTGADSGLRRMCVLSGREGMMRGQSEGGGSRQRQILTTTSSSPIGVHQANQSCF